MGGKSVKMLSFLDNEVDRKQVNAAFKKYDADGSGMLNRDEFKKVSYSFFFLRVHHVMIQDIFC